MPLKIRLSRGGSKKRPHYRIVLADSRAPRDGRFIERLGTYHPLLSKENDKRVIFNEERIKYWLKNGAQPSDRIIKFLAAEKIMEDIKRDNPIKAKPKLKTQERSQAAKDAKEAEKKAEESPAKEEVPAKEESPAKEEVPVKEESSAKEKSPAKEKKNKKNK